MDDLIEALTLLRKYGNPKFPTHCEHDELYVAIDPARVSAEDLDRLDKLGFFANEQTFMSYRFGSC